MNKATDPVLELLAEDLVLNGRAIRYTLLERADSPEDAPGRSTIYRALSELAAHGLVIHYETNDSYYQITETGRAYLRGESIADAIEGSDDAGSDEHADTDGGDQS